MYLFKEPPLENTTIIDHPTLYKRLRQLNIIKYKRTVSFYEHGMAVKNYYIEITAGNSIIVLKFPGNMSAKEVMNYVQPLDDLLTVC